VIADSTVEKIVQFQSLSASELEVFQACLAWSSKECHRRGIAVSPENQRSVLGSVLFHIRFPTMSLFEFSQGVSKANVLTTEERCAVFEYIACRGDACHYCRKYDAKGTNTNLTVNSDVSPQLQFPTVQRKCPMPFILSRFTTFCKSGIYSNDSSMMRMCTDRQATLRGFGVSGSVSPHDPLFEVTVSVKQERQIICNPSLPVTDDMTGRSVFCASLIVKHRTVVRVVVVVVAAVLLLLLLKILTLQ